MAIKPVQILIKAKDEASGVFGLLKKNAAELGATLAAFFGIRTFIGAVQGAGDLEAKLSEVRAVAGATAEEMQLLRKAAEDAGATTKFSATEGADALGNLARAGLNAQQAIAALPATLQLAQAGKIGLAESAEIVTRTIAGFSLAATDAGRIADVLAQGANASNTSVIGLGQALSYAAPTAVSLGLSLETTVAIIGKFADAGIDASRAGTALNAILSQFSDPASRFRQELAAMGITTNDFESALRQMAAAGPASQKAVLAVGTEAGPALRGLLNQGIGALDALKAKLDESGGSAATFAAQVEDNLNGSINNLGSAWDTVKNKLTTPVLGVLRSGVESLTGALREAVDNGTVGRFGDAIAKGFQAALEWARRFLSEVDFDALATRLGNAADSAGRAFATIADHARNAGATVQTAWGVMTAGANTVLTVIYTVGSAFASMAQGVATGVALLREGLASVSFGGLSAGFKEAAQDARDSAGVFGAAADALGQKASESLAAVAEGAQLARNGWAALTEDTQAAAQQASSSAKAFELVGATLKEIGGDAEAAGMKAQASAVMQARAAQQVQQEVRLLKNEYEQALAAGDVQLALTKLDQMKKALRGVSDEAKTTGQAVTDAFDRMGIKTKDALKLAADNAKRDFDLIKSSGQATAEGLQTAFKAYAEAAIAANGGVASELLKSQAEAHGLEIAVDRTGKAIVRAMGEGENATNKFNMGMRDSVTEVQGLMAWLDRLEKRNAAVKSVLLTDKDGFAVDAKGNRITQVVENRQSAASKLKSMGLDEESAAKAAAKVFDERGNYIARGSGAFREGDTLDAVLARLATQQKSGAPTIGRTVRVEINTPRGTEVVNTDEEGAAATVRALQLAGLSARG